MTTAPASATSKRVVSLDAFRAVTVALMIFMDHPTGREFVPFWLLHPDWHGFRLADTVFPAFIFIAGVSMAFSSRRVLAPDEELAARKGFLRRIALLFGLGWLLNLAKYGLPLRIPGVLQRIGLVSLVAYPFRRRSPTVLVSLALGLIAAHTAVLLFVGAPGVPAGSLDSELSNISGAIDTAVFTKAHTYAQQGFDPEGLLGTLTASATMLLGLATGRVLVEHRRDLRVLRRTLACGVAGIGSGLALGLIVPINKKLWTGSFTLLSAGIFVVVLVGLYMLTDLRGKTKAIEPLVPLGRNALAIYIGSNALLAAARRITLVGDSGQPLSIFSLIGGLSRRYIDPTVATLAISLLELAMWFAIAAWMHRRKIYIKL